MLFCRQVRQLFGRGGCGGGCCKVGVGGRGCEVVVVVVVVG